MRRRRSSRIKATKSATHTHKQVGGTFASATRTLEQILATLRGMTHVTLGTVFRILLYVGVIATPVLIEPGFRKGWREIPGLEYRVNILGLWLIALLATGTYEIAKGGKVQARWLTYWADRARLLSGVIAETGMLLLCGTRQGGREISWVRIGADLLQQIVEIVRTLTEAREGTQIYACLLIPEIEGTVTVALQATIYSQNTRRAFSRIPSGVAGPAWEAYQTNRPAVVPDTSEEPYRAQFEHRPYRSVVAFPVSLGSGPGRRLAVVTCDSTVSRTFTPELLDKKGVEEAISPYLELLGVLIVAKNKGEADGKDLRSKPRIREGESGAS
jgi:hypothetical protein